MVDIWTAGRYIAYRTPVLGSNVCDLCRNSNDSVRTMYCNDVSNSLH